MSHIGRFPFLSVSYTHLDVYKRQDLEDPILAHLDHVIASIHKQVRKPGTKEENTRTYLNAMKNPYVTIIGHCDDVKYPVDYLAIVRAAMEHQILLEINNSSLSPDGYRGDTRFNDLMILNPVSYTHLDVYKRQDPGRLR